MTLPEYSPALVCFAPCSDGAAAGGAAAVDELEAAVDLSSLFFCDGKRGGKFLSGTSIPPSPKGSSSAGVGSVKRTPPRPSGSFSSTSSLTLVESLSVLLLFGVLDLCLRFFSLPWDLVLRRGGDGGGGEAGVRMTACGRGDCLLRPSLRCS
eukprot:6461614-Amphidinium_carterae.1